MNNNETLKKTQPVAERRSVAASNPTAAPCAGGLSAALPVRPIFLAILMIGSPASMTGAQAQDGIVNVAPVVVTPTRVEQSSFDLPVSIDAFDKKAIQSGQPQVNLSETLVKAPGVVANERQNYAQDLQISIRGFGARAAFGVRGIRLIADGIPLTMPDGQSQAANIDLGSAQRIEVLRGPFSSLYGNSSGGVINVITEDGPEQPTVTGSAWLGDFGSSQIGLKFGGQQSDLNYIANISRFDTDGYREHSAATRDTLNSKFRFDVSDDTRVTLIANYLNQPETQDPRPLTQAQLDSDRTQAGTNAIALNVRKSVENAQTGAVLEHRLTEEDSVRVMGYVGTRSVEQFLGFSDPVLGRGVIGLDREFYGLDMRWSRQAELAGKPLTFTIGINYDNMQERRNEWNNDGGNKGILGRDEDNTVFNFDQFAQAEWLITDRWSVSGGVRHSSVEFESKDNFVTGSNGDDSGTIKFSETTPVIGAVFKVSPVFNLYANAGKGFETPTFAELAYASTDPLVTGLNYDLKPAISNNYEVGAKAYVGANTRVNAAIFVVDTDNELVVLSSNNGRTVYRNVDKTSREGFELAADSNFGAGFSGLVAYTYIDAVFDTDFPGNKIPGIPESMAYAELGWGYTPTGLSTAIEARWVDEVFTNDANSASAPDYTVVNWRLAFEQSTSGWLFTEFARINNMFDEQYVGSVAVNATFGRYYEPAPGRNFIVGMSASYGF